ncbi:glycosyltransferase family 2 protein [Agromyces sp. MMS24-K17]|uniref:glycosyltransferase family 2 protein n=1 Tax=Agromyces sp. MMS24-K17 TaxID=3372850 RepID=UPI003754BC7E
MAELAVITVTYRSSSVLDAFLSSLAEATEAPIEVHVADNSVGTDPSLRDVVASHPEVLLHELAENGGYGTAINAVARTVGPDIRWLVIVNPDVEFAPGSIDLLVDAATRHPRGGAFGPTILTADGEVYPSARSQPSLRIGVGHALAHSLWPDNPWSRRYLLHERERVERPAGWLSGACLLVSRDAFEEVDGFDERFFMYFEDVDLGRRLAQASWENVYVPSATVTHAGAHSTDQARERMVKAHHDSAYLYLRNRYPGRRNAPLRLALRFGLSVRARVFSRRSAARQ